MPIRVKNAVKMVRERTPARSSATQIKNQLGNSWVVESESDGDDEYTPPQSKISRRKPESVIQAQRQPDSTQTPRKRAKAGAPPSVEPDYIMPSFYKTHSGGSWQQTENTSKSRDVKIPKTIAKEEQRQRPRTTTHQDQTSVSDVVMTALELASPFFRWVLDVLGKAMHIVKTPAAFLLALYFLFGTLVFLRNLLFTSFYSALSPICRIPGTSYLDLPMCHPTVTADYSGEEPPPVEFDRLMIVQDRFGEVMREAAGGVSLPHDMKRGETSIRDLRQIVRYSQLRSKHELELEFDGFIDTARIASQDLQKFNSHVGRAVDNILATARWTKRVLDGIAERDTAQGAVAWFVNDKLLAPFQPLKFTEHALLEQYIQHGRVVEEEINRLVTEAQALLYVLQNLEDRLDVIHGIAVRDDIHLQGTRAEMLSQLWTMLGGNRSKLGKFDSQLRLLKQVDQYRQSAIAHVSGTMLKLQGMGTELEELRERVGGVELLGARGAVPLAVHIENIELGVERLERGRRGAKELENQELSKSLGRGKGEARAIEGG